MVEVESKLVAEDFVFLEAPRWHQGEVWVSDVFDRKLYRVAADGSKTVEVDDLPPVPNSIGFLPDGSLLVVSSNARKILRRDGTKLEVYADLSSFTAHELNDFAIDDVGRLYIGNFGYDFHSNAPQQPTDLHMVDTDGSIRVAASGLEFPNGIVIINDGRTLVAAETWSGRLRAFDRAANGTLSNGRTWAGLGERQPDGICADAEGAIWISSFSTGEVCRVLEGGAITHRIQFEGAAVACHLGGEDGRTLLCTTCRVADLDQMVKDRTGALHAARVEVGRAA